VEAPANFSGAGCTYFSELQLLAMKSFLLMLHQPDFHVACSEVGRVRRKDEWVRQLNRTGDLECHLGKVDSPRDLHAF